MATLLPSTTIGRRLSWSHRESEGQGESDLWPSSKSEQPQDEEEDDDDEVEANDPAGCSLSDLVPSLTSSPSISLIRVSGPSLDSTSRTVSSEYPSFRANSSLAWYSFPPASDAGSGLGAGSGGCLHGELGEDWAGVSCSSSGVGSDGGSGGPSVPKSTHWVRQSGWWVLLL